MKYTQVFSYSYKEFLRPILFSFDPESIHDLFTFTGENLGRYQFSKKIVSSLFTYKNKKLRQKVCNITFENPVGLSEGFDKDARLVDILSDVGFGFHQVGTVTYNPYEGNPKPRLYRLPKSHGISVYYGLKNSGAKRIVNKLRKHKSEIPMSISVGKTNQEYTIAPQAGIKDYCDCFKYFVDNKIGDFYTINISCPNTFGGEPFTTPAKLESLLSQLRKVKTQKAIFLKMPINTSWNEFKGLLDVAVKYKIDGVVIGNLNKNRKDPLIKDEIPPHIKGGISGKPTEKLSNKLIAKTYEHYGNKLVIIGVGGIFDANDAYEKIKRGASLVQLITGMIYEGPQLIGEINKGLVELLERDGYKNISDAVGSYNKRDKI